MIELLLLLGWYVIGMIACGILMYSDYKEGNNINLYDILFSAAIALVGPLLPLSLLITNIINILENSHKIIIIKSPYKDSIE